MWDVLQPDSLAGLKAAAGSLAVKGASSRIAGAFRSLA